MNGHDDVMIGAITTNNKELYDRLKHAQNKLGAFASAMDSYLLVRSLKTLKLRIDR